MIHVIVTCSNRKTLPVPPALTLGSLPNEPTEQRAKTWAARLDAPGVPQPIAAEKLYAGEHWTVAKGIPALAAGSTVRLWVCSAGYGLVSSTAPLRPYAAAFSGLADRVPGDAMDARDWWKALGDWGGPEPGEPRTIKSLALADPRASFLLALSQPYLRACTNDITATAAALPDPDRLIVISAGVHKADGLRQMMVPATASLQACLGGSRQALNARIAARLVAIGIRTRIEAAKYLAQLLEAQPPIPRFERKKLTDDAIGQLITARLGQTPGLSASRMLREFRDAGLACEQLRFAQLHRAVVGGRT